MKLNSLSALAELKIKQESSPKKVKPQPSNPHPLSDVAFKWHFTGTPPLHLQVVIAYYRKEDKKQGTTLATLTQSGWVDSYGVHWPELSHPVYGWHFVNELPAPELPKTFKL